MQSGSFNNSQLIRIAAVLVILTISVAIMIIAKSFLVPLAWSLVIALASFQMLTKIERKFHINRFVTSAVFVVLIILGIITLLYFFYIEIASIINGIPSFTTTLTNSIQNILDKLNESDIHIQMIDRTQIFIWVSGHLELVAKALAGFGKSAGQLFLIAIYLFFILYYRDNYLYFLKLAAKSDHDFQVIKIRGKKEVGIINDFLYGLFITTFLLAVILYVIFLLIGLQFALFWAILFALLTLVPYIGSPIGMVVVTLFALITNDGLLVPILALAGMIVSNVIRANVIKPVVIGNKINLNAFVIFLSVIVGGLIWGVSGMILFMPFAGIAKVLLESSENTKPLVALFITLPKDAMKTSNKSSSEIMDDTN